MSAADVPRRMLATPRRELLIRSMIEGDSLEFRLQNEVSVSENLIVNSSKVFLSSHFYHVTLCKCDIVYAMTNSLSFRNARDLKITQRASMDADVKHFDVHIYSVTLLYN